MTTEEKANAYDELKVKAQELEEDGCFDKLTLFDLFPELAESEDEKIRKELIEYIKDQQSSFISAPDCRDKYEEEDNNKYNSWISWLEKQGEKESVVVIPKFRVGDVIRPKGSTAEYTIESIHGECYHGKGWGLHISCEEDYELVEQKPTVEMKTPEESLGINSDTYNKIVDECIYGEQKPTEWSVEDERKCNNIIALIEGKTIMRNDIKGLIRWLKSLRPQSHWKPSENELEVLRLVAEKDGTCLMGLYENLKKLKEA